jgi:hypothetical protein
MPLDREVKSKLREKVSLANKSNVDEIIAEVEAARAGLAPDDKDYERLGGWLEDLSHIAGGKVIRHAGLPGRARPGRPQRRVRAARVESSRCRRRVSASAFT